MQSHDPYVPPKLRDPKAFAAFNKELVNAVTCCEAVSQTPWNASMAQQVLNRARRGKGRSTVRVSLPSEPSCRQRFMAFEDKEDGHSTYIIAFRSDRECYNDIVSSPAGFTEVENDSNFQVHKSLWWRAATMPLASLPPQWRSGLREGRHRLVLTGFSVGGAVAALATFQLLEAEDPDLREQICCYTFGTPLQGDQNYANCINQKYASNFYHVLINGDTIPGVLTLVSKVADNQPDVSGDVVRGICKLLAAVAQRATSAVLDTIAPGAGAIVQQIDLLAKLGSGIMNLIATEHGSNLPLPEYKFGGSLVLLDRNHYYDRMIFVHLLGDGRVLQDVFCVEPKNVHPSGLEYVLGVHQIQTFRQVINNLDNSAFKSAARSVFKDFGDLNVEDEHTSSRYLLQPHFDIEKPIQVWLDKHENITIEVSGKNMVLGIDVLYILNGKEKLRVPCTETYMPQWVENSKPMEQSFSDLPLHFSTQGIKGLSFKEPDGVFRVQLAFGFLVVPVRQVDIRIFDSWDVLSVAERFSTEQPTELIDLLLFWGMATAQAQCTAAFYAIQDYPQDADDTVKETLDNLRVVPHEIFLLDRLLALLDTSQFPLAVLDQLPPEMKKTLRKTTNAAKSNLIVPLFSADNESAAWTFSGCFTRTIQRVITKEMLSKKETAEKLSKSLDEELAGPKKIALAYIDHRFEYKEYAKKFSFNHINDWNKEKENVKSTTEAWAMGGGMLPVINLPLIYAGTALDSEFLIRLGVAIGLPTALLAAGLVGSAWWLYRVVSSPVRMLQNRPGMMAEWKRKELLADNWEQKLQAAALLFQCKIEPPHVACRLEFELYQSLKDRIPQAGCFNFSTIKVKEARYEVTTALQMANYGLAGARVYEIRRYLTERKTALGLVGSTRAGKSTFASQAFEVDSHPGSGRNARTRVLRHWTLANPQTRNRQFTLIDFPGSNDHRAKDWYIRGQLFASVLVVVLNLADMNSDQGVTLIVKACEARRKDKEVCILFCFTYADVMYDSFQEEAEGMGGHTTAAQLFIQNFEEYKKELLEGASEAAGDAEQLAYIGSNMHACCFKPKLQDETKPVARELKDLNVKNVKWVKDWCLEKLMKINRSSSRSGSGSFH